MTHRKLLLLVLSFFVLGIVVSTSCGCSETSSTPIQNENLEFGAPGMEIAGDVYGLDGNNDGTISTIRFNVLMNSEGQSIDFRTVDVEFATVDSYGTLSKSSPLLVSSDSMISSGEWAILNSTSSADYSLTSGEVFTIFAKPSSPLDANTQFNLFLEPSEDYRVALIRTTPPTIDSVNLLS